MRGKPIDPLLAQVLGVVAALLGGGGFLVSLVSRATNRDNILDRRIEKLEGRIGELEKQIDALQEKNLGLLAEKNDLALQLKVAQTSLVEQNAAYLEMEKRLLQEKELLRRIVREFPDTVRIVAAHRNLDEEDADGPGQ